ncbi:hypothetical protein [Herbaspirillum sp. CAH-3]|uniref:hypothetical protein n=1 Tax=Herbaspirillum sp. CAH-3 TaxID=2605746 RepID=UPI0012ACEAC9|nr:hypothetical protein [Herbaspirillum sp. CAH-3]MRT30907.1 hypothetical protein [Herbaspirillum sp. CAH-3]
MRRVITQIGQSIYEWLFTRQAQDNMVALAKLSAAVLGTSTQFNGLAVSPTSPASMQVSVAPGEIYMLAALEGTIYGTLAADTTHQIVKQGISLDASLLTLAAPSVAGQSINYLIQATFQETDISVDPTTGTSPVVLQFYNDSNPTVPYSGPNNSGATSNTFRQGSVVLSAKAGISATTGSQVTPSPDSGYVGIAVVTVANGQTTITSGSITAYSVAPTINNTLLGLSPSFAVPVQVAAATAGAHAAQLSQVVGQLGPSPQMSAVVGASATASLAFTDEQVIVGTALNGTRWALPSFNQTLNLATTGAGGMDTGSAPASGFVAVYAGLNTTTGARTVFAQTVGASAPTTIYSGANAPAGYNATGLISILPTNGSGQFLAYVAQTGRSIVIPSVTVLTGGGPSAPYTAISLNTALPRGSKAVSGSLATTVGSLAQANASLAPNAGGAGAQSVAVPATGSPMVVPFRCVLSEDRRIYYSTGSSISNLNVVTTGYEF